MKRLVICAMTLALLAGCSALPPGHEAHHPAGNAAASPTPYGYEQRMQSMQDMHRKMATAKTPDERSALMKDHMKAMQDGMDMMMRMMMDRSQMMERPAPAK